MPLSWPAETQKSTISHRLDRVDRLVRWRWRVRVSVCVFVGKCDFLAQCTLAQPTSSQEALRRCQELTRAVFPITPIYPPRRSSRHPLSSLPLTTTHSLSTTLLHDYYFTLSHNGEFVPHSIPSLNIRVSSQQTQHGASLEPIPKTRCPQALGLNNEANDALVFRMVGWNWSRLV